MNVSPILWRLHPEYSNKSLARLSITHGFFITMGGFHLFKHGSMETSANEQFISKENDIPIHPLAASDLYRDGSIRSDWNTIRSDIDFSSFTVPTEAEIKDKDKSDWFAKSFVVFQTSWFVMQCISRAVERLPVTHLEIVTLAYAAMNFVIYVFWWNKPLNVYQPVRVFRKSDVEEPISETRTLASEANDNGFVTIFDFIIGTRSDYVKLSREDSLPRFWANSTADNLKIVDGIMVWVVIFFGAIHCIAWGFLIPTHTELLIWRISCVAITAAPFYIFLLRLSAKWLDNMGIAASIFGINIGGISLSFAGILYILARVFTLAIALTSLRELPPGAFDTVHWTTFLPHV